MERVYQSVRAKQYDIPIHFKNEVLDMHQYKIYKNIDTVGIRRAVQMTLETIRPIRR